MTFQMKKCPNPICGFEASRYKCPPICPLCKAKLGPIRGPAVKVGKPTKVKKVLHPTVEIGQGMYSVQYHQHNRFDYQLSISSFLFNILRCLVMIYPEESAQINHCDNPKCVELRRMNVRNNTQFCCAHVQKAKDDKTSGRVKSP